ncbi:16S rRNA (guanine(527)-N(7))-methyltransferase RsmG [Sphingomonas sp. LB-2]|uniref:16S rRNA (guanine(527)-N(7))-methyltransferase RsmG n=1 Tax=Sphingomonas caeni TaxID=2984949 RepID=UPI002231CC81|nr:16S rRNA (guanine(527)-N(7))-methyltransferase RsmG [Sphingomonas caeni]MCW3846785.1 16S rRNA (guanine(527)-N(7))-methyltransferase RsmG [Sphingomonas caeni]
MTEDEARSWVRARFGVPRETVLARYAGILRDESARQNLIAASTLDEIWNRHLADSAQLIPLADVDGPWIDIGAGAGLPGLVISILTDRDVTLVEPRTKRAEFLRTTAAALGLDNVTVAASRIETHKPARPAAVISARAVAPLYELFAGARHCTDSSTIWLLPKGRNAESEVEATRGAWQGVFHVEPSITSPDSGIVIARGVRPR